MINENNITYFGKDKYFIKYKNGKYNYYLKHHIQFKNKITVTIEITYSSSIYMKKFSSFNNRIPKKHIKILSELMEYYESYIIMTRVLNEGFGYDNWFKKVLEEYDR